MKQGIRFQTFQYYIKYFSGKKKKKAKENWFYLPPGVDLKKGLVLYQSETF